MGVGGGGWGWVEVGGGGGDVLAPLNNKQSLLFGEVKNDNSKKNKGKKSSLWHLKHQFFQIFFLTCMTDSA